MLKLLASTLLWAAFVDFILSSPYALPAPAHAIRLQKAS
jgi:hypothetical protein